MVSGQYQHCQSIHLLLEHFALLDFSRRQSQFCRENHLDPQVWLYSSRYDLVLLFHPGEWFGRYPHTCFADLFAVG